jgi:hypothetical protein
MYVDTIKQNFQNNAVPNPTWTSKEVLAPGIAVYRGVLKKELDIINRLENSLETSNAYNWQEALVGYRQKMPEYRDCVDFKFKKTDLEKDLSKESIELQNLWQDIYDVKLPAVQDYSHHFRVSELRYWEAFNFIKYGPNQHFQEHTDHGFSYNCVVSLVGYVNDDYEGGELYFRLQDLTVKPELGDLYIFPSNYMYPHRAMPVHNGTKYSIVTMLDYSSKFHKPEFFQETND